MNDPNVPISRSDPSRSNEPTSDPHTPAEARTSNDRDATSTSDHPSSTNHPSAARGTPALPPASPSAARALGIAALVTLVVAAMSHGLPLEWAGSAVGIAFLWASYRLVAHDGDLQTIRHYGLSLGGLFEPLPIDWRRAARETLTALLWAMAVAAIVFPPFVVGFVGWWRPTGGFAPAPLLPVLEDALGQIVMVALPEEAFYRGYLQTALDDRWKPRLRFLHGYLSPGIVVSSAIFAVGHVLTEPHPNRLAVFFPALLFGWLRTRTSGIGAGVFFHAFCNLYSGYLGRSFGMWH